MNEILSGLMDLQIRIHRFQVETLDADPGVEDLARVEFSPGGDLLDLHFLGDAHDDFPDEAAEFTDDGLNYPLIAFLTWLGEPGHAERVRSLRFSGPDEGANGLKAWEFTRLLAADVSFPNLMHLGVELTDAGDHNLSVISSPGDPWSEGGTIASLLARMPALTSLTVPSAPDEEFFDGPEHPLARLRLQCGTTHQGFISNLAGSARFPALVTLDHAEVHDVATVRDANEAELAELFTSPEDFRALMVSPAGRRISHLTLRGTRLSPAGLRELNDLNPSLQLLHVPQEAGRYVSHL